MFEKLKDKALKVNLKKGFIGLVIAGVVFATGSGILMYQNFGDRILQKRAAYEQQWVQMVQEQETNTAETEKISEQKSAESGSWKEDYHGHNERFGGREYESRYSYGEDSRFVQGWRGIVLPDLTCRTLRHMSS